MLATALLCCALSTTVTAEVSSQRGEYSVHVEAVIDRPHAEVWALLTDYNHLTRLSEAIKESRRVAVADDRIVVDTVTRTCQMFFCRTVRHRQHVVESPPNRIVATTVPEHSNLRQGEAVWRVIAEGNRTRVEYRMVMRPDFWVPPFLGPSAVRTALRREAEELMEGLQATAVREQ